jgi:hypothetical protein
MPANSAYNTYFHPNNSGSQNSSIIKVGLFPLCMVGYFAIFAKCEFPDQVKKNLN